MTLAARSGVELPPRNKTVSVFLTNELKRKQAGTIAADYIKENLGASERCADQILKYLENDK
jgi:hypothetical protein